MTENNQTQTEGESESAFTFERVAPVFFLILVDVLGLTVILPLLHLYAARFDASPLTIAWVVAAFPLAQLVGVPMMGALSDRYGRKPLLLISQVTTMAGFLMLGFANTLAWVIASRVIDGVFGANLATAQAALTDISSDEERPRALGLTGAAFGIGFVLGPLITGITLGFTDSLRVPALIAAGYSFISILLTLFMFEETLTPERRAENRNNSGRVRVGLVGAVSALGDGRVRLLLLLMFAQQLIFFGFEGLLGLFTLSRLGLLGEGTAYVFLVVGIVLVVVQGRYIGIWSKRYGVSRLVPAALALMGIGMILVAMTPQQPPMNYIRARAERELMTHQADGEAEAFAITLPETSQRGWWGVPWLLVSVVPLSIGAGLIRPSLNTLITTRVSAAEHGLMLGVSSAFVSAANATAPILSGWAFQTIHPSAPFLVGGALLVVLAALTAPALIHQPMRAESPSAS